MARYIKLNKDSIADGEYWMLNPSNLVESIHIAWLMYRRPDQIGALITLSKENEAKVMNRDPEPTETGSYMKVRNWKDNVLTAIYGIMIAYVLILVLGSANTPNPV